MRLLKELQDRFGSRWVKVRFYRTIPSDRNHNSFEGDRFCEAVAQSYRLPLIVTSEEIGCPGARYVFGWDNHAGQEMTQHFCKELGFSLDQSETVVNRLPRLKPECSAVGLNQGEEPDVFVSYLQPEQLMWLVQAYEKRTGQDLVARFSPVTSVCGDTVVRTFLDQAINVSFGCPKARKYGKIGDDRLLVGLAPGLARVLIES